MEHKADKSELHAVRCCKESGEPGWYQRCPGVWAASYLGEENNECYSAETHKNAELICAAKGARLCTVSELLDSCASSTGCGHNRKLVWSSTFPFKLHSRTEAKGYAEISDGLVVGENTMYNFDHDDWVTYDDIWFGPPGTTTKIRFKFGKGCCNGRLLIRRGDQYGKIIGILIPWNTGAWDSFTYATVDLTEEVEGLQRISLVGRGHSPGILNLEWFQLMP
mmetsp:Transcript_14542/g.42596  ORF Transcript_14542/g.42596 Transcript_14542/m.42596 type:complete len:222 (-) Transcript_14542:175-840(-)